jgi:hypothetical protein
VLGVVRDETPQRQPESARGYLSRRELSLHIDLPVSGACPHIRPSNRPRATRISTASLHRPLEDQFVLQDFDRVFAKETLCERRVRQGIEA